MRLAHFLLLITASAASSGALSQVSVNINVPGLVQVAPPPPRYESVPRAMQGQVWIPGRWEWNERAYAWRPGQWQRARPDYVYAPGRWVAGDGGWRWSEDQWRRREQRHDRSEEYGDRREQRHEEQHRGEYHCPPGQAKKGRC